MNHDSLFRPEVLERTRHRLDGGVFINTPVQYKWLSIGFFSLLIFLLLFLSFAEFSEKCIVKGYLNSSKGMVRVYSNKQGVIVKEKVIQGSAVKQGDPLLLIDTSYEGFYSAQRHSELENLQKKKALITMEIASKKKYLQALKPLLEKHYIPRNSYEAKQDALIVLQREKYQIELELIHQQHTDAYVIRSPVDGIISSVLTYEGQFTRPDKPLLTILPANADLVAELFVPVKQSGFLKKSSQVILRYDAFPHERFGTAKAVIRAMSQNVLTDAEDDKPIRIGQPFYKITAALDKSFVTLYGHHKTLQQGMTLTAVIVGSKKKLWQWILDPLYSYSGELFV